MKFQKKVKHLTGMLLAALLMVISSAAMAQDAVSKVAKSMTDSLAYLQLTPTQTTSAQALNTTAATSLVQTAKKAKTDTSFRGKALAQQVMGIMKTRNGGLQKLLTPDQTKLYQAHKISQMADVQTKIMTAQLSLTDAQVPQVYDVNKKATADMMGDAAKLKGAKGKVGKFKSAKSLKGDSKDKDKELKKILTPDQYTIYEKHEQEMKDAMKAKMKEKKG
ncbi:hypothetical protein HDF18_17295 [Mucilaginibacter sp. X5P1]|uniref:hypothetical protein n=1 Tax=Mucilaginibacter sp. X5P1 TaxID=2723088 RepID=UPI0016199461|nr:hypothetical protein [Mucilaginibacter sp. X5P1]MBB6139391.1 hypothetical protein [Mucilaginibacter sp. X5P1]